MSYERGSTSGKKKLVPTTKAKTRLLGVAVHSARQTTNSDCTSLLLNS